jgi:phage tail-like protein
MSDPAIGYRFHVTIDKRPLGVFTKVEGLGARYDVLSIKEGGQNTFGHNLPGRLSFDNLKLTRPVDADSGRLAAWFSEFKEVLQSGGRLHQATASISAFGPDDQVVARWDLDGVHPVSYSGPSFQAGASSVLSETIEVAHHGFVFGPGTAATAPSRSSNASGTVSMTGPAVGAGASI